MLPPGVVVAACPSPAVGVDHHACGGRVVVPFLRMPAIAGWIAGDDRGRAIALNSHGSGALRGAGDRLLREGGGRGCEGTNRGGGQRSYVRAFHCKTPHVWGPAQPMLV